MKVRDVMNSKPVSCQAGDLISEAARIMKKKKISGNARWAIPLNGQGHLVETSITEVSEIFPHRSRRKILSQESFLKVLKQIIQMVLGDEIQKELPGKEFPLQDADPSGDEPPTHVVFYLRNHTQLSRKQL